WIRARSRGTVRPCYCASPTSNTVGTTIGARAPVRCWARPHGSPNLPDECYGVGCCFLNRPPGEEFKPRRVERDSSLIAQRFNRIEERGFPCRIKAEENSDGGAEETRDDDCLEENQRRPFGYQGEAFRRADAQHNADPASDGAEREGFH